METHEAHCCDHCGAVAGKKRPVGRYTVELFGFEYHNEFKLLCITCLKYYKRMAIEEELEKSEAEKNPGFFEGLFAFTKRHSHSSTDNITM